MNGYWLTFFGLHFLMVWVLCAYFADFVQDVIWYWLQHNREDNPNE